MKVFVTRGLPWARITLVAALLWLLLGLVRFDPWTLWPLQGLAVGLLAGGVGWCLDEPAAAVVDAAPRGLAWRTGARSAGVAVLVGCWFAAVGWAAPNLFGHARVVLLQGVVAAAVAGAFVTWRRTRGEAVPGHRWAMAVVPLAGSWALARPFERRIPVFPYAFGGSGGDWSESAWGWGVAGAAAVLVIAGLLVRDGRPARPRP